MMLLLVVLVPSMIKINLAEIPPAPTYFFVDPEDNTASTTFVADIKVTGAPAGTHAWEIKLSWVKTVVSLTKAPEKGDFFFAANATSLVYTPVSIANLAGSITIGQSLHGANTTSGAGTLCSLNFTVGAVASSFLNLTDTVLAVGGVATDYPNRDGFFYETGVSVAHDIEITDITLSSNDVNVGTSVTIDVDIANTGTTAENFDVIVYADVEPYDLTDKDDPIVGSDAVNPIDSAQSKTSFSGTDTVSFSWDTTGVRGENYTISAEIINLALDDDPHDNLFIDGSVMVRATNDIKVTDVSVLTPVVLSGEIANVTVTVVNQGQGAETVDVVLKADTTVIETKTGVSLAKDEVKTLTFNWNTTGYGGTFTMTGYVPPVSGEAAPNTADNTLADGTVKVDLHDVKVTKLLILQDQVKYEHVLVVTVAVENQGSVGENPVVAIYADKDNTTLGDELNYTAQCGYIAPGETIEFSLVWPTEGYQHGGIWLIPPLPPAGGLSSNPYTMSAYLLPVYGETDTADNFFTGMHEVIVRKTMDINDDGTVNVLDIILALVNAGAY